MDTTNILNAALAEVRWLNNSFRTFVAAEATARDFGVDLEYRHDGPLTTTQLLHYDDPRRGISLKYTDGLLSEYSETLVSHYLTADSRTDQRTLRHGISFSINRDCPDHSEILSIRLYAYGVKYFTAEITDGQLTNLDSRIYDITD